MTSQLQRRILELVEDGPRTLSELSELLGRRHWIIRRAAERNPRLEVDGDTVRIRESPVVESEYGSLPEHEVDMLRRERAPTLSEIQKRADEVRRATLRQLAYTTDQQSRATPLPSSRSRINVRRKGAAGELEVARLLRGMGLSARRSVQYCGRGGPSDIQVDIPLYIEVKRRERLNVAKALADAADSAPAGHIPLVIWRRDYETWTITLYLEDLPRLSELVSRYMQLRGGLQD